MLPGVVDYGEDLKYIDIYMKKGYDYIGIGGLGQEVTKKQYFVWADEVFAKICNKEGYPIVKTHGFAMTSFDLMLRYPWYSVDSTSWVMTSRFGGIYMSPIKNGQLDILTGQTKISVSTKNSDLKKFDAHYFNMIDTKKEIVNEYIKIMGFKMGKSEFKDGEEIIIETGLCNNYKERDKLNIKYFMKLEEAIPPYPRQFKINKGRRFF